MIEKEDLEILIKDEGLITWAECDSAIVGIVSRCHLQGKISTDFFEPKHTKRGFGKFEKY